MEEFLKKLIELGTNAGGKIIFAIVVFIIGRIIIRSVMKLIIKAESVSKMDKTIQSLMKNIASIILYSLLIITVIGILGIPMTSIVTVVASCGLAVGLSLQGALSNLAGGIMILIFKPFRVDDYISASGAEGTVTDIGILYTSIVTIDNKRITVPNGDLMNSNVTNFSSENGRRVDLTFKVSNASDRRLVSGILLRAAEQTKGVKNTPAPFARLTGLEKDTFVYTVRAWCDTAAYWDVYYDLLENCVAALGAEGIGDPVAKVSVRDMKEV